MKLQEIVFIPQYMAEDLEPAGDWAVISITEPGKTANLKEGWKEILRLQFHDVDDELVRLVGSIPKTGLTAFSEEQAREILDFVEKIKSTCNSLVVHCHAGLSRSAAVALYISEHCGIKIRGKYDTTLYNRMVYRTLFSAENAPVA